MFYICIVVILNGTLCEENLDFYPVKCWCRDGILFIRRCVFVYGSCDCVLLCFNVSINCLAIISLYLENIPVGVLDMLIGSFTFACVGASIGCTLCSNSSFIISGGTHTLDYVVEYFSCVIFSFLNVGGFTRCKVLEMLMNSFFVSFPYINLGKFCFGFCNISMMFEVA